MNAIDNLTLREREIVAACIRRTAEGLEGWEDMGLGPSREDYWHVLKAWPEVDVSNRTVHAVLFNALEGVHGSAVSGIAETEPSPSEVGEILRKLTGNRFRWRYNHLWQFIACTFHEDVADSFPGANPGDPADLRSAVAAYLDGTAASRLDDLALEVRSFLAETDSLSDDQFVQIVGNDLGARYYVYRPDFEWIRQMIDESRNRAVGRGDAEP